MNISKCVSPVKIKFFSFDAESRCGYSFLCLLRCHFCTMATGFSFPTSAYNFEFSDFHESTTFFEIFELDLYNSLMQFLASFSNRQDCQFEHKTIFSTLFVFSAKYSVQQCSLQQFGNTKSPFPLKEFHGLLLRYGLHAYPFSQIELTFLNHKLPLSSFLSEQYGCTLFFSHNHHL
jgi:hypothetical protein